jgi:hypothetical protein
MKFQPPLKLGDHGWQTVLASGFVKRRSVSSGSTRLTANASGRKGSWATTTAVSSLPVNYIAK